MANETSDTAAPVDLSGMPAGKNSPAPVAAGDAAANPSGLVGGKISSGKPLFGGNVGKKVRADGFKAGSPEALAADLVKDAARKRRERDQKRLATPPPALPSAAAPKITDLSSAPGAVAGSLDGETFDPVLCWTAEDFRQCAPELVELAEAWRVECHVKHAIKGKLPGVVVEEIKKDAAFPPGSKKSLSNSSPATLAKLFNSLKVPVAFKSMVSGAPALLYIIVRDLQTSSRIEKLIRENVKLTAEADSKTPKKGG